jgi:hypothetical protein
MALKVILEAHSGNVKILGFTEHGLELDIHRAQNTTPDPKLYVSYHGSAANSYGIYGSITIIDDHGNVIYTKTREELGWKPKQ